MDYDALAARVEEDAADFGAWSKLLAVVEETSVAHPERVASTFEAFLAKFPLCFGYWCKYAELKQKLGEAGAVDASDGGLLLKVANRMYGVAAPVDFQSDGTLVVQYEVTLTDGLSCGGAYIKLLEDPVDVAAFDDQSGYVVMFGPDKCGGTDKVHVILRQENPVSGDVLEHHLKDPPKAKTDKAAHLYSLAIRADDTFVVHIDGEIAAEGSLMDSLEPPLTPEREVDDENDLKPEDWVDAAKIDDEKAKKPFDWDEDEPRKVEDESAEMPDGWLEGEPTSVPDPDAKMPDDWDVEEDGSWEAPEVDNPKCGAAPGCGPWNPPLIDNPNYKGKWVRPKIDNPAYKGKWFPKKIPNPVYFEPSDPAKKLKKVGALAVEVWTTNKGITYDNFYLGASVDEAKAAAEPFYEKKAAEQAAAEAKAAAKAAKKAEKQKGMKGALKKAEVFATQTIDTAKDQPLAAAGTLLATLVSLSMLCGKKKKKSPKKSDDDDDDDDEEEEEEEDEDDKKSKKTPKAD
mmetsp:Transcript_22078/g.71455  ORF Transcript_22078/g.71455 Transcript_22078/m.71455 type:complete len:515 (-) Transcript_22078:65-1609(-)